MIGFTEGEMRETIMTVSNANPIYPLLKRVSVVAIYVDLEHCSRPRKCLRFGIKGRREVQGSNSRQIEPRHGEMKER